MCQSLCHRTPKWCHISKMSAILALKNFSIQSGQLQNWLKKKEKKSQEKHKDTSSARAKFLTNCVAVHYFLTNSRSGFHIPCKKSFLPEMLDCIKHMTTICKRGKPIFISPHTDCYSRKKYGRSLFFELEEILEVDPKIEAARSSFIFYKAYTTGVNDKVTINPRFATITIIRRLPFVHFPHVRATVRTFPTPFPIKTSLKTMEWNADIEVSGTQLP